MRTTGNRSYRLSVLVVWVTGSAIFAWCFCRHGPLVSVFYPLFTLAMTVFAHQCDRRFHGGGIRHRYFQIKQERYNLDSGAISTSITKQSVLAGVALGLLIVVAQVPLGGENQIPSTIPMIRVIASWIAILGFSGAILMILMSLLCYDYTIRFNWPKEYKARLCGRALWFDIGSWYLLTVSLVLSTALIDAGLCMLLNFVYGLALWISFPLREDRVWPRKRSQLDGRSLSLSL